MSRSKKPTGILGPDGKPLPPAPKPKAEPVGGTVGGTVNDESFSFIVSTAGTDISDSIYGLRIEPYQSRLLRSIYGQYATPKPRDLRAAVAEQVGGLTADLPFEGRAELPAPPVDLTTYADAMRSALAKCPHEALVSTLYGREWQCDDCGVYLDLAAYRRWSATRPYRGLFG